MWIFLGIITYILFWLTCIVSYTVHYLTSTIQITSFSQVIYTLNAGAEGASGTIGAAVGGFFASYWPLLVTGTIVFGAYLYYCVKRRKAKKAGLPAFSSKKMGTVFNCSAAGALVITGCVLGARTMQGYSALGISEYFANVNRVSDLYENNYVEPTDVTLEFPKKKKNLIHIVVESLENTYASTEHGGGYREDLLPNLYELAKEGTDFTPKGTNDLNGALVANNTGWTVAGLVAQSSGTPLNVGNGEFTRNFQSEDKFLPHLTTLGDILKAEGYHNYFMCGSNAAYAGRANYYKQHGDYTILDWGQAKAEGFIPQDYGVWWGFEDLKLFEWAQKKLPELAKKDQPFNFTMLTADTHFEDGYLCEECEDEFDTQYKNVIACTDRQITRFVRWVQKQDFYKDTTIVISGDHLSMDGEVAQVTGGKYNRKAFAIVLNGPDYTLDYSRTYTTMDLFPTILEALGVKIEGHRLGLGTSLYSSEQTLAEKLGIMELNAELTADSKYYNEIIMSGDETRIDSIKKPDGSDENKPNDDPNVIVPLSAQEYMQNQESFDDPNYVYTPPADTSYIYYPVYEEPQEPYVPEEPIPQPPISTSPAPQPPISVDPTPEPPISVDPTPEPPISVDPTPEPPISVDPTPEPPISVDPTPEPPISTDPAPQPPTSPSTAPEPADSQQQAESSGQESSLIRS